MELQAYPGRQQNPVGTGSDPGRQRSPAKMEAAANNDYYNTRETSLRQEMTQTTTSPETHRSGQRLGLLSVVCQGLLSLLLLSTLIGLRSYLYTRVLQSPSLCIKLPTDDTAQLQSQNIALKKERDWLKREVELLTERHCLDGSCLSEWQQRGCSCYVQTTDPKTWFNSRLDCQRKGADLVVIDSEEEQVFINNFNRVGWIGLTDIEEEGIWKWVDGTPLDTGFWLQGEPNNLGARGEDCAVIYNSRRKNPLQSWNDSPCNNSQLITTTAVCEKQLLRNNYDIG